MCQEKLPSIHRNDGQLSPGQLQRGYEPMGVRSLVFAG
jgi:hypothetical protein